MHMARVTYLFPPLPTHKTHRCLLVRPPPGIGCWRCWLATQLCWCFVWAPPELDRELSPYYLQRVPLYYSTTLAIIFKYSSSVYIYNIPCYQHKLIKRHNHPENELINTLSYQINPLGDHLSAPSQTQLINVLLWLLNPLEITETPVNVAWPSL